jgi:hypothetical protein
MPCRLVSLRHHACSGSVDAVRAYLLLSVLAAWTACIVGAALLTGWLAVTGVRALRRGPGRPDSDATAQPSAVFAVLGAYAALMVAAAAVLAGLVLGGPDPGEVRTALAWAALPAWAAIAALSTAAVLWRRRSRALAPTDRPTPVRSGGR